jgi:lipoprotein NlpD
MRYSAMAAAITLSACTQEVMVRPAPSTATPAPSRPSRQDAPSAPSYTVQPGDTLYKISVQYGVDYRDLASWNDIAAPYTIYPKQQLRVGALTSAPSLASEQAPVGSTQAPPSSSNPVRTPPANAERVGAANVPSVTRPAPAPGYDANLGVTLPEGAEPIASSAGSASSTTAPVFESVEAPSAAAVAVAPTPTTAAPAPAAPAPAAPAAAVVVATTAASSAAESVKPLAPSAASPTPNPPAADVSSAKPSAAGWIWPSTGKVVVTYANGDPTRQGIDIAGEIGQPVRAARDGEVVYSGAGLIGYGELVIIKHSPELLSAYGHNRVRLVKEGDKIKAGQKIAEMGKNATNRVLLHFEVRKNGKPVDPLPLLPAR